MIQRVSLRSKTNDRIAQTIPIRELSECHTKELIATRKLSQVTISAIPFDTRFKRIPRNEIHHLRKNISFDEHTGELRKFGSFTLSHSSRADAFFSNNGFDWELVGG